MKSKRTRLKKAFDKGGFDSDGSLLKIMCWYLVSLLFFRSGLVPFSNMLVLILRIFGAKIGSDVRIKPCIYIRYPWKLVVGNYSWLADCYIDNLDQVIIGENVCVSQQAMLLTGNHNYKSSAFSLLTSPIVLEEGVWIAAGATVCPGITAASHSVLGPGAVAFTDLEAYSIYRGNPALKIRARTIGSPAKLETSGANQLRRPNKY